MILGSSRPAWGIKGGRRVGPTTSLPSVSLENVAASTSNNPMGLHGLVQGWIYLYNSYLLHFICVFLVYFEDGPGHEIP
jgi:hypothetical protein